MNLLYLILQFLLVSSFSFGNGGLECKEPSKSDIFKYSHTHKPFELTLLTNQESLNKFKELDENEHLPSLLIYKYEGIEATTPILVKQRGNSRRESCEFKPLEISFLASTFSELIKENNQLDPITQYHNLLNLYNEEHSSKLNFTPVKTKIKPFKGLGKHLNIVSHCGRFDDWLDLEGLSLESQYAQEQVLLQEYYLYKIQNILYPLSMATQIIKINYLNPKGVSTKRALGFIRERPSRTAKRCGYRKNKLTDEDIVAETDFESAYQAEFLMLLFGSFDFFYYDPLNNDEEPIEEGVYDFEAHNFKILISNLEKKLLIPYDYDLSTLIREEPWFPIYSDDDEDEINYWESINTIEKRSLILKNWILTGKPYLNNRFMSYKINDPSNRASFAKKSIENFLKKKILIENLIRNSLLSDYNKSKYLKWLKVKTKTLEESSKLL